MTEQNSIQKQKDTSRPRKKNWKKELNKKLALNLVPWLAHKWMSWFNRTALANNEEDLTLVNWEALRDRVVTHQNPSILAIWHNRLVFGPTAYTYLKGKGAVVMVSRSFDGDVISATLEHFPAFQAVRGSSAKKGKDKGGQEALDEMIEFGRQGYDLVITPDGPQGPVYQAKRGIVDLARATGYPIFPAGCNASKYFEAKSWDKTRVPFPYAKFVYTIADPIWVPEDADEQTIEEKRIQVEKALKDLTHFADHFFDQGNQ